MSLTGHQSLASGTATSSPAGDAKLSSLSNTSMRWRSRSRSWRILLRSVVIMNAMPRPISSIPSANPVDRKSVTATVPGST